MKSVDFRLPFILIVLCFILRSESTKSDYIIDDRPFKELEKDPWMQSDVGKLVMSKFKEIETKLEKQDGILQQLTAVGVRMR